METHIPGHFVHELNELDEVLEPFRVLDVALVDEDEGLSQFSLQDDKVSLDGLVNGLLLFGSDLLVAVLTKQLDILQQILLLRLFHDVVDDINMPVDSGPLVLVEMGQFHLSEHFDSDWDINQQKRKLFEVLVLL
jgi:hypothetical protein